MNNEFNIKLYQISLIDQPEKLLEFINENLKPKQIEKKKFGEVFTPMKLVNEMLDQLPKEVWTNKKLKWLDPANGMGNFPIAIYQRLMKGLENEIKNKKERKKYILENMLYMCELNKKNCFICKQIFDLKNEYKMNIYNGNTLELNVKKVFGVDKFDIIVGNPPYNQGGIKSHTGKQLGDKNITIWPKFVEFTFNHLKQNGWLVFIHPLSWLRISHSLHDILLEKHI